MKSFFIIAAVFISLPGNVYGQRMLPTDPDAVFYNGKVVTIDPEYHVSEAFAVKNGRFLAVGSSAEVQALAGPDSQMVDLDGHAVVPGLMDNHNHQYHVALLTQRGVDIKNIGSLSEMLQRLQQAASTAAPGETIYTTMGWSAGDFPERRGPSREELDAVGPNNPVVVYAARSRLHINSAALNVLGINRDSTSIPRIIINKDENGEPTGLITGQSAAVLNLSARVVPPPSLDEKKVIIKQVQAQQHAMGLTGIRDLQLYPDVMRAYFDLWLEGGLTMRVSMGLELNAGEEDQIEAMLAPWGVGPGFGDEWLRLDGIAEYNPGDQVREPYSNGDGTDIGTLRLPEADFIQAIRLMNHYGWRPAIHVAGDRTLDLVLDAYEAADRDRSIKDKRWIVEHIVLVHDDQLERMKRLGVMVSAQFQPYRRAGNMVRRWGQTRTEHAMRIRDLLDSGIIVSGGSDWPGSPNNPFINIYYYVTRDTLDLGPVGVEQKISRQEAIKVMSLNNAYLTYEEHLKGSIEPGKLADFLILSHDILSVPEQQIRDIYPLATYVGGRNVYSRVGGGF